MSTSTNSVLVIDDEPTVRMLIVGRVEVERRRRDVARDGLDALALSLLIGDRAIDLVGVMTRLVVVLTRAVAAATRRSKELAK